MTTAVHIKLLSNAKLTWDLEDGSKINWMNNYVKIAADDPGGFNARAVEGQSQTSRPMYFRVLMHEKKLSSFKQVLTWNKPINDQHELYGMAYWGQRAGHAISIDSKLFSSHIDKVNPWGGVIDFDRQFLWGRLTLDR